MACMHSYGPWSICPVMVNGQHSLSSLMGHVLCYGQWGSHAMVWLIVGSYKAQSFQIRVKVWFSLPSWSLGSTEKFESECQTHRWKMASRGRRKICKLLQLLIRLTKFNKWGIYGFRIKRRNAAGMLSIWWPDKNKYTFSPKYYMDISEIMLF